MSLHVVTQLGFVKVKGGGGQRQVPIAYEVHERGLATHIPQGTSCESACAFLFFAGTSRSANGRLGVHQIASSSNELAEGQQALGDIFHALEEWGVPSTVFVDMMNTPATRIHYYFLPTWRTSEY
jgi:hypothetical protein